MKAIQVMNGDNSYNRLSDIITGSKDQRFWEFSRIESLVGSSSVCSEGSLLAAVARAQTVGWNEGVEESSLKMAQRMSITLHRENARAILRRLTEPCRPKGSSAWADWQGD